MTDFRYKCINCNKIITSEIFPVEFNQLCECGAEFRLLDKR